jgi:hypothetical protein
MKKLLIIALLILPFLSCKKKKEEIAQDLVIQAMTNGQWVITKFTLNGSNITADFSEYKFQYYSNKKVDAIKNGSPEKTGDWDGNATAMTTWANFSNVVYPLNLINGTWHITNNGWTYVEASQTIGTDVMTLRLDKL